MSAVDGKIRTQQAELIVTLNEESLSLREEKDCLEQERARLKQRVTELEQECRELRLIASETSVSRTDSDNSRLQLRNLNDNLSISEARKDKALVQCDVLLEENAKLKEKLEKVRSESSQERITWMEETNDYCRRLAEQEEAIQAKAKEVGELQKTIELLSTELATKSNLLQAAQLQLEQARQVEAEVAKNDSASVANLKKAQEDILQKHDAVATQLQETLVENRRLNDLLSQQQREIERMQRESAEREQGQDRATNVQRAFRSVGVGAEDSGRSASTSTPSAASKAVSTASSSRSQPKRKRPANIDGDGAPVSKDNPVDLDAHASEMPRNRREVLDAFPEINVILPPPSGNVYFTKTLLSQILGGSMQGLVVRITESAKPLAVKWDVKEYLCPNMDHNPWSPTHPGKHGYMQVGLGQDRLKFNTPEIRHIFIGVGGRFRYSGKYEVMRVDRLSVAEWKTLLKRREYSKTTSIKEKKDQHGTVEEIRKKYDNGDLLVPCVLLKCIEFNVDFHDDLVDAVNRFSSPAKPSSLSTNRKRPALRVEAEAITPSKKARNSVPEPSAGSPRRSGRVHSPRISRNDASHDIENATLSSSDLSSLDWEED